MPFFGVRAHLVFVEGILDPHLAFSAFPLAQTNSAVGWSVSIEGIFRLRIFFLRALIYRGSW